MHISGIDDLILMKLVDIRDEIIHFKNVKYKISFFKFCPKKVKKYSDSIFRKIYTFQFFLIWVKPQK